MKKVRYIGLDVHKETIVIATADEGRQPAMEFKTIPSDYTRLLMVVRLLTPKGGGVVVCYEAGPTGYGLYRRLREAGIDCRVVAPSLVPTKAGNRIKTDRRDAVRLAHYLRSGDLTEVYVPDEADEALRDLERSRDDAKRSERTARHQLGKFLLRYDRHWDGKTNWTARHMEWIRRQIPRGCRAPTLRVECCSFPNSTVIDSPILRDRLNSSERVKPTFLQEPLRHHTARALCRNGPVPAAVSVLPCSSRGGSGCPAPQVHSRPSLC